MENFEEGIRWMVATGLMEQYVDQLADKIAERLKAPAPEARYAGALGDLVTAAEQYIKPGMDGYAHLLFARNLLSEPQSHEEKK